MLLNLFTGKLPALLNEGFDWVDVRDVVAGIHSALIKGRRGEKYLISGRWAPLSEFADLCHQVSGTPPPRWQIPSRLALLGIPFLNLQSRLTGSEPLYTAESIEILRNANRNISSEKARKELQFVARPLQETIQDGYDWLHETGRS